MPAVFPKTVRASLLQVSLLVLILGVADLTARFCSGFALTLSTVRSKMLQVLLLNEAVLCFSALCFALSADLKHLVLSSVIFGFSYGNALQKRFSFLCIFFLASLLPFFDVLYQIDF